MKHISNWGRVVVYSILAGFGAFYFLWPAVLLLGDCFDPNIRNGGIPMAAWRTHYYLADRYGVWADERLKRHAGLNMKAEDVAGTEWPLFGCVFYLAGEAALQEAWIKDTSLSAVAPAVACRHSADSAVALVLDPAQASWVKGWWGAGYMTHQDLFYRYLRISAMASYTQLTGSPQYTPMLKAEADSLIREIDGSPYGLLDDYPLDCFPTDIIAALAAIQQADKVTGSDHAVMIQRAIRAFQGKQSGMGGLPAYNALSRSGKPTSPPRGCGTSFALVGAARLWPEQTTAWNTAFSTQFWQTQYGWVGYREFAKGTKEQDTFMDIDSGPVIWGYGVAASAFGVAAARTNGDMEKAAPLTMEMLGCSWPLPTGELMIPRVLSDAADAKYLGEAGILYCLTRTPVDGVKTQAKGAGLPVYLLYLLAASITLVPAVHMGYSMLKGRLTA